MPYALTSTAGPLSGTTIPLAGAPVTIGRDPSNAVCVLSNSASRFHCRLEPHGGGWRVVDLQARNKTLVNGKAVEERMLAPGDRITVGTSIFVFSGAGTQEAGAVPPGAMETVLERGHTGYLEPARKLAADARTVADLGALVRISRAIQASRSFEELERLALEALMEVSPADHAAILTEDNGLDAGATVLGWTRPEGAGQTIAVSRTIVDRVLREGVAILSNNPEADDELASAQSLLARRVRSVLAAPLPVGGQVIGVLYLDAANPAKPFDTQLLELITAAGNILAMAAVNARYRRRLEEENGLLRSEIELQHDIVGDSPRLREVLDFVSRVAPSESTVLVHGESGTGKELVARAIHRNSPRRDKPFVAINCAALTETLLESELFGHEKGAFTGATAQKKGKLEAAEGGTVFLDEIGEMSAVLQAKMLRVLQERECERVGGTRTVKLDIRLIAATNRDLKELVKAGTFRGDLFYRINVVSIRTPPLRERKPDIPALAEHFAARHAGKVKRRIVGISPRARQLLLAYDWPGNVRELENAMERAVVLGTSEWIQPDDLPESVLEGAEPAGGAGEGGAVTLYDRLREAKKAIVIDALQQTGGNFTHAGELLGVHANHLHRLVRTLGIDTKRV